MMPIPQPMEPSSARLARMKKLVSSCANSDKPAGLRNTMTSRLETVPCKQGSARGGEERGGRVCVRACMCACVCLECVRVCMCVC